MKEKAKSIKPRGETFVWFTSLGLGVGITMVAVLLALILRNGLSVFWPDEVVQIRLKDGSAVGGQIVKKQEKIIKDLTVSDKENVEWQLFLGNKDIYGLSFRFIDERNFQQVTYPKELIVMERIEYGNAIAVPKTLAIKGEGVFTSANPDFVRRFRNVVAQTNRRREEIEDIEKKRIGAINHEMEELRIQERILQSKGSSDSSRELAAIKERVKSLDAQYELLANQASELRAKQDENFLNYVLVSGEAKQLSIGQVVYFYYPNQLSFFGKSAIFLRNVWHFLSDEPREANTEGGIFPAIFGTFVMTLLLSLAVTPFGVLAAIYLREYAKQGLFVRSVRIAVNNLAGVPSIVFGVFGLGFFVYLVGGTIDRLFFSDYLPSPTFGTGGILWASLTLALMTVPVVIVATEESLASVPRGMREGSLACGASKWQTIQRVVLPASAPGILTGLILAMARGAGEVAPLMLVGVVKLAPSMPIDTISPYFHLDQKFMHLGFHIYDLGFQSPDSEAAKPMVFATTLLLILLVVLLNLGAIIIRERLRRKYSTGAF